MAAALARVDAPTDLPSPDASRPDPFLSQTRAVLGVPLRGAGELLGFVALGPGAGGEGYDVDDRDLLRAIAHHAGVLLAHARMADDRQASAELDALNRFAAFYLHDFKNLAARLSLVAQNAAKHGDDPEFRAEAMKTVGRTAEQMGELMLQLSRRSPGHGRVAALDLTELVSATLRSLGPDSGVELAVAGRLGQVVAVPEQLQQVVLNLVLNARRALERAESTSTGGSEALRGGRTRATRGRRHGSRDSSGAPAHALPAVPVGRRAASGSASTKSKRIVESYRGTLRVESEVGRGTRVVVELPAESHRPV